MRQIGKHFDSRLTCMITRATFDIQYYDNAMGQRHKDIPLPLLRDRAKTQGSHPPRILNAMGRRQKDITPVHYVMGQIYPPPPFLRNGAKTQIYHPPPPPPKSCAGLPPSCHTHYPKSYPTSPLRSWPPEIVILR